MDEAGHIFHGPLYQAIRNSDLTALKNFLEENKTNPLFDIEFRFPPEENTPLLLAAKFKNIDIFKTLLEYGADITAINENGFNCLHLASKQTNLNLVKYLVESGFNLDEKTNNGKTAIHLVFERPFGEEIAKLLVEHMNNIDVPDDQKQTPLLLAIWGGYPQITLQLIEKGANVNVTDTKGTTPLHWAATTGSKKVIKALIEKGANLDAKNEQGETPAFLAAQGGNVDALEYLAQKGANLDVKNNEGESIFDCALKSKKFNIIKWFIENNCVQYHPEVQLKRMTQKIKKVTDNLSFEELLTLPKQNLLLLRKLVITGELLKIAKKLSYDKQIQFYNATKEHLKPENRKEFENLIRTTRKNKESRE